MKNNVYEKAFIEIYSLKNNDIIVTSLKLEPELDWDEGDDSWWMHDRFLN